MSSQIFVQSYSHLDDKPNAKQALEMLKRVASLVKPIMRKHGWILPLLSEFFPDNPQLLGLNVNMGQQILVRLRPAHSPDSFMPMEEVIGTMLHELTHNVHGPHDTQFYKFLDGLQEEYDELQRNGYKGEGFYSVGNRLGGNVPYNIPLDYARQKAVESAEKRRQLTHLLGQGAKRLGGSFGTTAGLSPRELAARAAERRLRDEKTCTSGPEGQREATKAASQSTKNDVIDLTLEEDSYDMYQGARPSDPDILFTEAGHSPSLKWVCPACTLLNSPMATCCTVCQNDRPAPSVPPVHPPKVGSSKGKAPGRVSTKAPNNRTYKARAATSASTRNTKATAEWSCTACTLLNATTANQCMACQTRKPFEEQSCWACYESD